MNLENMPSERRQSQKIPCPRFHLWGLARLKADWWWSGAGGRWDLRSNCLGGTGFSFGRVKMFWH